MYNKCFFLYLHIVISNLQLTELVMRKIMNEQLPISKSSPLKARFYDYPYFTYPWHFHTEYEVIYVKEGTGMRFVGNNAEKYADGDIILLGSDLPHYMKSEKKAVHSGQQVLSSSLKKTSCTMPLITIPISLRSKICLKRHNGGFTFPQAVLQDWLSCSNPFRWRQGLTRSLLSCNF